MFLFIYLFFKMKKITLMKTFHSHFRAVKVLWNYQNSQWLSLRDILGCPQHISASFTKTNFERISFYTETENRRIHEKKSQRKGKIQQSTKIVPTNLNEITVYRISTYIVHITVEVAELTSCSNYNTTLSTEDLSCKKNKHTLKYPSLIFTKCIQFITTSLKDFVTRFSFSFQSNHINYFLLLTKKQI